MLALSSLCLALGACLNHGSVEFKIFSARATHVEVCLFAQPTGASERRCIPLNRAPDTSNIWSVSLPASQFGAYGLPVPAPTVAIYYGYRMWGPNWDYDANWRSGSAVGFKVDVDGNGNRFNPNKLLLDPFALEISHGLEPLTDPTLFNSGESTRSTDSGPQAPKGVLIAGLGLNPSARRPKPETPLKDDVIYEVQLKGLTMNDPNLPQNLRGTYLGAARRAAYLRDLGVTAVEFLPLQQRTSATLDYWGYMTLGYFAPQRSLAVDQSAGGPTREFREMVEAFHREGLKVYIDVVYNHTGEGGIWGNDPTVAQLLSFRGIDNATYYDPSPNPIYYNEHTGCGNDFASSHEPVRELIMQSLKYWQDGLGVDGFRFDLAPLLGNNPRGTNFNFDARDPRSVLARAPRELPVRPPEGGPGVDLIAEPWAVGQGTYQQGHFPQGWAEWNGGAFRDPLRSFLNLRGVLPVTLGQVANAVSGSASLFQSPRRGPWSSVNILTTHDGFTLHDLFSFDVKQNAQAPPYGPSDGGSDVNLSWNQGGDPTAQRQITRTALLILLLSTGVPLLEGGDEFYRSLNGNNNPYNLDTIANYLAWPQAGAQSPLTQFVRFLLHFRARHQSLRPLDFFKGAGAAGNKDLTWYRADALEMTAADFAATSGFLGYRIDNSQGAEDDVRSIYVAINADFQGQSLTLPRTTDGYEWRRSADTAAWFEAQGNFAPMGSEPTLGPSYYLNPRSALLLVEKPIAKARTRTVNSKPPQLESPGLRPAGPNARARSIPLASTPPL